MKPVLLLIALLATVSSCAPGAFNRSRGVPLGVSQRYVLQTTNTITGVKSSFEFAVDAVSRPAMPSSNPNNRNTYVVGPYVISYGSPVDNLEWFEYLSNGKYLLFTAGQIGGVNFLSVDIDRASLDKVTNCEFRAWKYGDTNFVGAFSVYIQNASGSYSAQRAGSCTLTLKP
jgi:hypothetical protein